MNIKTVLLIALFSVGIPHHMCGMNEVMQGLQEYQTTLGILTGSVCLVSAHQAVDHGQRTYYLYKCWREGDIAFSTPMKVSDGVNSKTVTTHLEVVKYEWDIEHDKGTAGQLCLKYLGQTTAYSLVSAGLGYFIYSLI